MSNLTALNLRLLGPARIEIPGNAAKENEAAEIPRFRSRRTLALLGYLATEQRPVARHSLATLFWPDEVPSKGRANLRRELHNLAQILPGCWELSSQTAAFAPSKELMVDIYTLSDLEVEERWLEAVELLQGEFLEGLFLDDNLEFESWLLTERERWRGRTESILARVIEGHIQRGRFTEALAAAQKLLQITPWNEKAHRQVMRLLAWSGRRGAALRQFESCKATLWEELAVELTEETLALYQQIQAGELDSPPQLPAFLTAKESRHQVERPYFVAREAELAWLDEHLQASLTGQCRIVFVTGSPGRGKTALMNAFARRAMASQAELLVATGNCNAYAGAGDPYLPFRDVVAMLTGDVEARWDAGVITRKHATRLWAALPLVLQALLGYGPHLINALVPGQALLQRAQLAGPTADVDVRGLRELVHHHEASPNDVEQSYLFQETTEVFRAVAREQPMLLILDDIQWADAASIGLLFHLGRRLLHAAARILIVCAYRPEEVAFGREGTRHPLAQILSEFKLLFGDVWLGLGPVESAEGRRFVDALLDGEPNRLSTGFRSALLQRTQGHPLYTVELLRTMQERGDLIQDERGCWVEGPALNWEVLPARAESVIAERINRLNPQWQEILDIASVEGEVFTAQVVAEVHKMDERPLLGILSGELGGRHRLIREHGEVRARSGRLSRYSFGHVLFQEYLYRRLSPGERRLLHAEVAAAMEKLYEGELEELAVQLGHHLYEAGDYGRALPYFTSAAERAARVHANEEAVAHYTTAIELAEELSLEVLELVRLHRGRGLVFAILGEFQRARADFEVALQLAHDAGGHRVEWRLLLDMGKTWTSRDYQLARDYFGSALELARRMDDPAALAGSLNWMGNWYANAENPLRAAEYHQEALEIVEELGDLPGRAKTLDLLGIANLLGANLGASVHYYDQAVALFQELDDRPRLLSSLMGRGTTISLLALLTSLPPIPAPDALGDIQQAIRIARKIHAPTEVAWARWTLGLLYIVHGEFGLALETMRSGLDLSSEIGHEEWLVGNRFALGVLYNELFAPEKARSQLEEALERAQGLRSQYWINHVSGALAATYLLLDDPATARTCLDNVLSPATAMDTMGKRYCWARRATLALFQGDPALALDIAERLIATAPGRPPGGAITFLWKLKGDALVARGLPAEAEPLFQVALANATTHGERFLLWRVQASLGRLYHTMDRHEKARASYSAARKSIEELADTLQDDELTDSFLQRAPAGKY
jgi:DNA-binding SARP family transcriptional activator